MNQRRRPRRLTDLELEIMHVVWDAGPEPVTVREVAERLSARTGKDHAYTTVQTMMGILRRKGALSSRPGPGRAHTFSAGLSRDAATSSMTSDFVQRLFGGRAETLLSHLLDHESVDRETLEDLKRRIDSQLGEEE